VRAGQRVAGLFARRVVDEIARNAEEPALEFCRFFEGGQFAPGDDECFLREVFALGDVAARTIGKGGDGVLIFGDELGKSVAIAVEDGLNQACVV
jgi:hypothetical protein